MSKGLFTRKESYALCNDFAVLRERLDLLERYAGSIAMWMERENVTDQERLSYIKWHPVTRAAIIGLRND